MKLENFFFDVEGYIKFVDFGFVKWLGNNENDYFEEMYIFCGILEYFVLEVIYNKGYIIVVDWWVLGILIYEFLIGYLLFWYLNLIEIYK